MRFIVSSSGPTARYVRTGYHCSQLRGESPKHRTSYATVLKLIEYGVYKEYVRVLSKIILYLLRDDCTYIYMYMYIDICSLW